MQGRVIGAAGLLYPCTPCIELYYQRCSHHFHSSGVLTQPMLPVAPVGSIPVTNMRSVMVCAYRRAKCMQECGGNAWEGKRVGPRPTSHTLNSLRATRSARPSKTQKAREDDVYTHALPRGASYMSERIRVALSCSVRSAQGRCAAGSARMMSLGVVIVFLWSFSGSTPFIKLCVTQK